MTSSPPWSPLKERYQTALATVLLQKDLFFSSVFALMTLLWIIFAKFFVALSTSWNHPSHRRIPTSEGCWEAGVGSRHTRHAVHGQMALYSKHCGFIHRKSETTEPAISGPGSGKANGPILMQPSSMSRDEHRHRCKWDFPKQLLVDVASEGKKQGKALHPQMLPSPSEMLEFCCSAHLAFCYP